jgi:hypothetical protein
LAERRGDHAKTRRYVNDLERQNLPALRPDLVPEFEHLKQTLVEEKGEGLSREPPGSASGE